MADVKLAVRDFPAPGEDWDTVSGAPNEAQTIAEAILTPLGSLPWDRRGGSLLPTWRNSLVTPEEIIAELERVAAGVRDVIASTVHATYDATRDRYRLTFTGSEGRVVVESEPEALTPTTPTTPTTPVSWTGKLLQIGPNEFLLVAPGRGLRIE